MIKQNPALKIILLVIGLVALFGIFKVFSNNSPLSTTSDTDKIQLIVSILPQQQIVERIAGDEFVVDTLIPPGYRPETYDPTSQELKVVAQADFYFGVGHIPFEETHLDKIMDINPDLVYVDTSINNRFRNIEAHNHDEEEHNDHDEEKHHEDEHEHEDEEHHEDEIDPHVWLSPKMVQQQAEVIYNTLAEAYPEYGEELLKNYDNLVVELDELDQDLTTYYAPIAGKTILVYHPAFGYLARDYNFVQEHIEIEGKEPSIADVQNIIDRANEENIRVVFVQKQFSQDSAKAIAENINGVVVEIDPLDPDYFENMRNVAKTISEALLN